MMPQLICIPFKKTLHVDLKTQLSKVIDASFYQTSSMFADDLIKLSNLRESVMDATVSEKDLSLMKEYYFQFSQLKKKFPDNQLEFTWFETLGLKSYGRKGTSFQFEELNVVYNIGAMYTLLAAESNDSSSQGQRKACVYFQTSAGCFDYILRNLDDENNTCMDKHAIAALRDVMLAQAQEMIWWKAVGDNLKQALIARLALQVSKYYELSWRNAKRSELIKTDWENMFKDKSSYFSAVANFRHSIDLDEKKQYGAKIRALKNAVSLLDGSTLDDDSTVSFRYKIQGSLKVAERDNDLIYLQPVPPTLTELKPAPMVKTISFDGLIQPVENQIIESIGGSLFRNLLPVSLMENSSAFNERQEDYVQKHIRAPLEALSKLLKEKMPTYELPEAIKSINKDELHTFELSMEELKLNNKNIEDMLYQVTSILEQEAYTDELLRSKHGSLRWTMATSEGQNSEYLSRYEKIRSYLEQGRRIDRETFQLFTTVDKALLTDPIKLPESNNSLVKEAADVMKQRENYILEVEAKSRSNTMLPKIISSYKSSGSEDFESLFAEHLKLFRADLDYVQKEKRCNERLIEKITNSEKQEKTKRLDARDIYVQDFKYSLKILDDVKDNIKSGSMFYQDLMKSAAALLHDVQQFEASRREEKKNLETKLLGDFE